jgi:hypothetical protein
LVLKKDMCPGFEEGQCLDFEKTKCNTFAEKSI